MGDSSKSIGYEVGKVIGLGGTFTIHGEGNEWPNLWLEPKEALVPEGEPIQLPPNINDVVIEAEPTVVIDEELWRASEAEAEEAIRGFTVSNDVTVLGDWPANPGGEATSHANKMFPTFRPLLSEYRELAVEDVMDLHIEALVDGEVTVSGSMADLKFTIPEMLSHVSDVIQLEPHDIVALGRPERINYPFLDDAEKSVCRIEKLGELVNPVERLEN
jgi:2-keto-4-pentenoate hydratase/2-oxohepta-3-ene-1,7-dioic acid hydratase in catechol pathway